MTSEQTIVPSGKPDTARKRSMAGSAWAWLIAVLGVSAVVAIAWNARNYPDARVGNPNVTGAPRPVEPLFGFNHWLTLLQVFTIIAVLGLITAFVWGWRKYGAHPVLLMGLVTTIIVWQDPMMNWAPYAVYNPRLWHFPEVVAAGVALTDNRAIRRHRLRDVPTRALLPGDLGAAQDSGSRPVNSFVWRHPLISLATWIFVFGFIIDMILEVTLVRTGMYIYAQVIPFGSIFVGTPHQFPLLWESALVTLVMIPAGVLIYRDDTGRTVAEKLASASGCFSSRPVLGSFLVMLVIVNAAYLVYGAAFTAIKWSGAATSVACPWPYPDAKAFDPQGYYEKNGQQGPFSAGIWSKWMSGQPDGRPNVKPPANGGRCGPNNG